ncbi:hypothetical protein NESM_000686100 [Novymonas esmeraldas]|uniref:SKP1 component POZ domain-containing protein n=1 Tax=Novymonas esmeraldas TaxID=1808958 RepID=A0AAW0EWU5_9TRYP
MATVSLAATPSLSPSESTAAPQEVTITIISSDGETFSLRPSVIAHSHLLQGAVRRWAEVYHATPAAPASDDARGGPTRAVRRSDEDEDEDDATTDDLEETPDENYIARFYEETTSDLGAVRGPASDGGAAAHEEHQAHVVRMVSVPIQGEEEDEDGEGPSTLRADAEGPPGRGGGGGGGDSPVSRDDTDSDRTASVLPASVEGIMSNTSSPFKSHSNGDTPTRAGDAAAEVAAPPRSLDPLMPDCPAPPSPSARHAATTAAPRSLRSPAVALVSPASRGSHQSPSTLMDADQSTPSVLSDEDGDGQGECDAGAARRAPSDPRNLGDDGLDDAAVTVSVSPSPEPEPQPAADSTTAAASAAAAADVTSNGRVLPQHKDPAVPRLSTLATELAGADGVGSGATPLATALSLSSPVQLLAPSGAGSGDRGSDRRRSSTVVQAAAAADDVDDDDGEIAGGDGAGAAAGEATAVLVGSARSGSGRPSASPPPPDWRSPSSCHQRTPCMADEDDVGAMMSENGSSGADGSTSPLGKPQHASGVAAPMQPQPSPTERVSPTSQAPSTASGGAPVSTMTDAAAAATAATAGAGEALASSVAYAEGIRITSSAIVFDLMRPTTPNSSVDVTASPQLSNSGATAGDAAGAATGTSAPPQPVVGQVGAIHSSALLLCIRYMTHFAEVEAQAAKDTATAVKSPSATSSSSATAASDDDDDDDTVTGAASTVSDASFSPAVVISPAGVSGAGGSGGKSGGVVSSAGDGAASAPHGGPATIPEPLSQPLVALLSPWERTFLYADVLTAPEATLTASLAIMEVCPGFDYAAPSASLGDAKVRAALMAPPPPPDGVRALVAVMAAARQLQIAPLHALCAGWLADFVVRVSYGATDNFEAAHLIRQCLRVPSDWSRRETDCLKMENEWPANEDAE